MRKCIQSKRGIKSRLYIGGDYFFFFLGEETNCLSGDGEEVVIGQSPQRLVKQLLGDGLCSRGEKPVKPQRAGCDDGTNRSDSYRFRLPPQVIQQLLVFHGGHLALGLDQLPQGLGHLLPALAGRGTHTCNRTQTPA